MGLVGVSTMRQSPRRGHLLGLTGIVHWLPRSTATSHALRLYVRISAGPFVPQWRLAVWN